MILCLVASFLEAMYDKLHVFDVVKKVFLPFFLLRMRYKYQNHTRVHSPCLRVNSKESHNSMMGTR